jgi:hypothetical protein
MIVGGVNLNDNKELFLVILAAFISIPIQLILYIINVFRNTSVAKNQKVLWAMLLLFFNWAILPVYCYLHIWRDSEKPVIESETAMDTVMPSDNVPRFPKTSLKIFILLAGFLPIVFIFAGAYIVMFTKISDSVAFFFGIMFYVSIAALIIFYIYDVFHNHTVANDQRVLWTLLLIIGHIFVFPFYWYFHIWKKPGVQSI